jgi:hypothetical protein
VEGGAVPDEAGAGDGVVRVVAGDELVDGDAGEFLVGAPFVVRGEHEVEVECAEEGENLAAVGGVDSDEYLVEKDQAWGVGDGFVVGCDGGEEGKVEGDGFLSAGEGAVEFLGQQVPVGAASAVEFDDELVTGGVVEDVGELFFPGGGDVLGFGFLRCGRGRRCGGLLGLRR